MALPKQHSKKQHENRELLDLYMETKNAIIYNKHRQREKEKV